MQIVDWSDSSLARAFPLKFLAEGGGVSADRNRTALTAILIMCGIMLGSGLGAAFGNVAIGICTGMALGGLAAIILNLGRR